MSNNNELSKAVRNISAIASRDEWVFTLDNEEGTLFYSPERIADNAELHQITDDYALYMSKDMKPQGVMIEYYGQNFIKHHKEFKELYKKLFFKKEGTVVIDPQARNAGNDVKYFKALLIDKLLSEATLSALV